MGNGVANSRLHGCSFAQFCQFVTYEDDARYPGSIHATPADMSVAWVDRQGQSQNLGTFRHFGPLL
jgi:hypothetical protein